MEFTLF